MKVYLVGGAIRNHILGLPITERDWVVVGATPQELIALGYLPVGQSFPVFLHPKTKEEYALARTERKTGPGYHGFNVEFSPDVTLEEDLMRRDLTINAIAQDEHGNLIDPHRGRQDLKNKVLRHVSEAFQEDPVRLLRLARFWSLLAPLGFTVADETLALCKNMVANGEVDALTPERVFQELERALATSPQYFFILLRDLNAFSPILKLAPKEEYLREGLLLLESACAQSLSTPERLALFMSPWDETDSEESIKHLRLPKSYQKAIRVWSLVFHAVSEGASPTTAWVDKLFQNLGLWGTTSFESIEPAMLLIWQAKKRNRDEIVWLKSLWNKTKKITAKDAVAKGLKGHKISQWISEERKKQLNKACQALQK